MPPFVQIAHLALNLLLIGIPVLALFVWLMPHRVGYFALTSSLVVAFPFALDAGITGATTPTRAAVVMYMGVLALCLLMVQGATVLRVVIRRRRRRLAASR